MSAFSEYWDTTVKPVAKKCIIDSDIVIKMNKNLTQEDVLKLRKEIEEKGIKDVSAMFYIDKMIWAVEHDLADGRNGLNLINSVLQVRDTLNSDSYWENVWNKDVSTDEAKNLKELADLMVKLVSLL